MTNELIALIVKETGWSLEYIRNQPLSYLYALAEEFQYRRAIETYQHAYDSALVVCTLASSRTRHYKPEEIIGEPPKRGDMAKSQLSKEPKAHKVKLADGKEYDLPVLNLNVLADLEEEFGCGLEEISNLLQTKQASSLRTALYILLHRNYPKVTKDEVGRLVDMKNLTDVATSVAEALSGE